MIKNKSALIFFVLDIGLIILATVLAFALRFDAQIPEARLNNLFIFILFAVITTPAVFYLFNLYKLSWSYLSLTDLPIIIRGVGVATLFLGTILYITRNNPLLIEFPRSIIFLYGMLLFF